MAPTPPRPPDPHEDHDDDGHHVAVLANDRPDSRVTKTLRPDQPGAQRWLERYGPRLVCVRYREDIPTAQRYITVELRVETKRAPPPRRAAKEHALVAVRIDPADAALRARAFAAGATCDARQPVWRMPPATAQSLGLLPPPTPRRPKT